MQLLSQIAKVLRKSIPGNFTDREVKYLLTDSRSLVESESSLFFALSTQSGDGHKYVKHLYDKGVRMFCVNKIEPSWADDMPDAIFLKVQKVRDALQKIASAYRSNFDIPIIAITGSRGKTVVKEWLYQMLGSELNVLRSPRSYNSQIGVPLSIWELSPDTELAILEAGVSQAGEMDALESMIRPSIGIITNVGDEHSDGFASEEQKVIEKSILLRNCDYVIYNYDDMRISHALDFVGCSAHELSWSRTDSNQPLFIKSEVKNGFSTSIKYSYLNVDGEITIPYTLSYEIDNAIACLAVLLLMRKSQEDVAHCMSQLTPVGTRMDVIEGVNSSLLIYDSYTCDLHSLAPALDFMALRSTRFRTPTVILSDVLHENLPAEQRYCAVANLLQQRGITRLIGIGEEISKFSYLFKCKKEFYPSTREFLENVTTDYLDHELVLIKGASKFNFVDIADFFEAKHHETVLEVNLDNVVHNFNYYKSLVKPGTGIVAMVKASGYGAGSFELGKTLQSQGASYLAVATVDEGVDLRKSGITMPIMVLNPRVANYASLFKYNLEPEIYSFDILHRIIREGLKYNIKKFPIHIKVDTGMHRLGFLEPDMEELSLILKRQTVIYPCSVFSHLAAADDPGLDSYTFEQFDYFNRCYSLLQKDFDFYIKRHILNSTGITRFPNYQFDMVRLGICLYGIKTLNDGSQDELKPVSSLYTTIISIKEWDAGTTIGYNRRGLLKRKSRIATIPIGYADGIDRHLGNGNMTVCINGSMCRSVGNICMDIMMVDITDASCEVGDTVEVFGPNIPVSNISDSLDTIPYEVLTSIGPRVKRVYYRE